MQSLKSAGCLLVVGVLVCAPAGAQTTMTPDAMLIRAAVDALPIGATVRVRMRGGERFTAVLLEVDEAGIRVKPATRIPEPSRLLAFDRIERVERHQDRVSVAKYAGVGSAIGALVLLLLVAGI